MSDWYIQKLGDSIFTKALGSRHNRIKTSTVSSQNDLLHRKIIARVDKATESEEVDEISTEEAERWSTLFAQDRLCRLLTSPNLSADTKLSLLSSPLAEEATRSDGMTQLRNGPKAQNLFAGLLDEW
jgi:hypothetical protein